MSKIKEITELAIIFDDGSKITYDHMADCCEWNYADFEQLDDIARITDFDTENMFFKTVKDAGFIFGNQGKMFFVPCYSEQNGCYTPDVDIYYNDELVLTVYGEFIERYY